MRKKLFLIFIVLLVAACGYIYHFDNRSAADFSSYCHIDFRNVREPENNSIVAATLSITDYSFMEKVIEPSCRLIIDGEEQEFNALKAMTFKPSYLINNWEKESCLKHANILVFAFPPETLEKIKTAETVRIAIKYKGHINEINLPLNDHDLQYWKNQLN